jgi:hypothetical protein
MKNKIALIGAIEGTANRVLEKDYLFFIKTLRKNGGQYANIDVYLLQPTNHDILESTLVELKKYGVNFIKKISDYNQPGRDFNYTNKPIACNYFYNTISDEYDYFLWIDGDVAVLKPFQLPELIEAKDIVFLHNNEFYDVNTSSYITHNSENFIDDAESYRDMLHKIDVYDNDYVATNSWFIYASSKSLFWKEWNNLTRDYIYRVSEYGKEKFKFANNSLNFENRIEELTMDIIIRNNNLQKIFPVNIHTFNTPDLKNSHDYVEKFNRDANCVHFDDITYLNQNFELKKYFADNAYLKSQIVAIYGIDVYKNLFLNYE